MADGSRSFNFPLPQRSRLRPGEIVVDLFAGGGHFVECRCRATRKHADADTAIAEWRRVNRPARVRRAAEPAVSDNVVQMRLPGLATGNAA